MNAPNALPAATAPTTGAATGLFGAMQGAQGAGGPLAGFEALLAAFFGAQGKAVDAEALLAGGKGSMGGLATSALLSASKGTHPMDDALNLTADADKDPKDPALADALIPNAAPNPNGISADAQTLAALLAQPTPKPVVVETAAAPPAETAAPKAPAAGTGRALLELTPEVDGSAAQADLAATDAAAQAQAGAKARLAELAQTLSAGRPLKPAPDGPPPGYSATPPPPTAAVSAPPVPVAVQAAEVAAQPAAAVVADAVPVKTTPAPAASKERTQRYQPDATHPDGPQSLFGGGAVVPVTAAAKSATALALGSGKIGEADAAEAASKDDEIEIAPAKAEASDDAAQVQAQPVTTHATSAAVQAATTAVRGSPETMATLAAQIIKKLEARTTRFDMELHPADLGRVDVRLEIGAHGRLTAAMSFDDPHAAAELRGRADELKAALESAGFDLSGGLSFDVAGDRGQRDNQAQQNAPDYGGGARGRAFEAALATAGETATTALAGALSAYQRRTAPGVDIRI